MKKVWPVAFGLAAFVFPLGLYLKTLAPSYIPIDSAEFAMCMHFWGMCHPPGFPLYVMLGKFFSDFWPWASLIYKANLLSAIFGAVTILFVYLTLVELRVNRTFGLFLSLMLAVSAVFWEFSISADVFSFAAFLTALTFYFAIKKWRLLTFFALGISASHFYISAVLWPMLAWYFWDSTSHVSYRSLDPHPALRERIASFAYTAKAAILLLWGSVFALGFFPQAVLYWRMQANPEINWGHAQGMNGFVDYVRRREFGNIFLISNPVLKFSIINYFKHIYIYFYNLLIYFGIILPVGVLLASLFNKLYADRRFILFFSAFLLLVLVQLFLLSTIDPTGEDNPFQINKFYLTSYVPAILLIGMSAKNLVNKFFDHDFLYPSIFMALLVFIYLFANFKVNDLSSNSFSQSMVLDAMDELPTGSVAITVSHIFRFGSMYEQKINHRYEGATVLYFPNEKNRDNESYYPQIFKGHVDYDFVQKVSKGKEMGNAEAYILQTISKNLDRPVLILQGTFEEKFFAYLKPYLRPYGMWWRVEPNLNQLDSLDQLTSLMGNLRNKNVKYADFNFKQLQLDTLNYAVSYHTMGVYLASLGKYEEAVGYLNKSFDVNPKGDNIAREIELVKKTQNLAQKSEQFLKEADHASIIELGNNLFTLGNFKGCMIFYSKAADVITNNAQIYNNLAACQASSGNVGDARLNYKKALALDPKMDLAKKGLEALKE